MLNLAVILEDTARASPLKTAFAFGDKRFTFKEINEAASRIANALKAMGVEPGDRVAVSCPNLPYFPMVMFGILKAGAVFTPLNILLKPQEIAYHLADSGAKVYFCFEGNEALPMGAWGREAFLLTPSCELFIVITADPAAPSPFAGEPTLTETMTGQAPQAHAFPANADDPAIIIYTSGTTGDPKGAELTHANVMLNTYVIRDLLQYRPDDVSLLVLPLFHIFGLVAQLTAGVLAGVTNVLMARFDPEAVIQHMDKEKVSVFCGAPTMYWALLHHQSPTVTDFAGIGSRLRCCISAGQSMPGATLRAFEARFLTTVLEGYGMSETSPVISFNRLDMERKIGSVGTPVWGVELKVVDGDGRELPTGEAGEVLVRGHNVLKCYHNAPEKTAEALKDGWFHTGDVGRFDEDGYLYLIDRVKDMINRGGESVYPTEVEKMLCRASRDLDGRGDRRAGRKIRRGDQGLRRAEAWRADLGGRDHRLGEEPHGGAQISAPRRVCAGAPGIPEWQNSQERAAQARTGAGCKFARRKRENAGRARRALSPTGRRIPRD